jgi:hypothetical protein
MNEVHVISSYGGTILMPSFVSTCVIWLLAIIWLSNLPPLRHFSALPKWLVSSLWLIHFIVIWYAVFKVTGFRYMMSSHLPEGRANYDFCTYISYTTGLSLFATYGLILISLYRSRSRPQTNAQL